MTSRVTWHTGRETWQRCALFTFTLWFYEQRYPAPLESLLAYGPPLPNSLYKMTLCQVLPGGRQDKYRFPSTAILVSSDVIDNKRVNHEKSCCRCEKRSDTRQGDFWKRISLLVSGTATNHHLNKALGVVYDL